MWTIKTQFVQDCALERVTQNHAAHKWHTWQVHIYTGLCMLMQGSSLQLRVHWRGEWGSVISALWMKGTIRSGTKRAAFWLLSLRQEEAPDVNRGQKPGVRRHLLPLMSAATTSRAGADSKNYLADLQPPLVPTVTHNCSGSSAMSWALAALSLCNFSSALSSNRSSIQESKRGSGISSKLEPP